MSKEIIPIERVAQSIRWIRGQKVLLDSDLAVLYGVTTENLNKAVRRNRDRFPSDFLFQVTAKEAEHLIFQIGRSKGRGVMATPEKPRREIGFNVRETPSRYRVRKRA